MKTSHTRCAALSAALFFAGISGAFGQGVPPPPPPMKLQVTFRLHSGRPNPAFEPTGGELKQIKSLVDKLPENSSENGKAISYEYSYAGIDIGPIPGSDENQVVAISVYKERIEVRTFNKGKGSTAVYKRDDDRALELWLVALADSRGVLDPKYRDKIASGEDVRKRNRVKKAERE